MIMTTKPLIPTASQDVTRRAHGRAEEGTHTYMSSEANTQQSHSLKGEGYIEKMKKTTHLSP